jgi:hypothetical protein
LLLLGLIAAQLVGALLLGSWGMALGACNKHQRAADLAAVSAARAMADAYPRLFEPLFLPDGCRTRATAAYERVGREAALQARRRSGSPRRAPKGTAWTATPSWPERSCDRSARGLLLRAVRSRLANAASISACAVMNAPPTDATAAAS